MFCIAWRSDWAALAKAASSAFSWASCWAVGPPVWLLLLCPTSLLSGGAGGARASITALEPAALDPSSLSEVPPRMPPEPLVVSETLAGAK